MFATIHAFKRLLINFNIITIIIKNNNGLLL